MPSSRLPIALAAVFAGALTASCSSNSPTTPTTTSTTTATTTAPAPSTTFQPSISFSGGDIFVVGQTGQLSAVERQSATTSQDVTSTATWTSSNPDVATVSAAGLVTAVAKGSTIIKASDSTASGSLAVSVVSQTVSSLLVVGPSTIPVTQNAQLTASASTTGGLEVVTAGVTWQSSNPNIAAVSDTGVLVANTPGAVTITATYQGVKGTLPVTVVNVTVTSIVFYGQTVVTRGLTGQLTASATLADGSSRVVTNLAAWQSLNTDIATVSNTGLVTASSTAGVATITATYLGVTGSVDVTVN